MPASLISMAHLLDLVGDVLVQTHRASRIIGAARLSFWSSRQLLEC
jgi:hypothetical protein